MPAVDVVIRAAPAAYRATFEELQRAVRSAVERIVTTETHREAQRGTEDGG
jgi:RNase P protein component